MASFNGSLSASADTAPSTTAPTTTAGPSSTTTSPDAPRADAALRESQTRYAEVRQKAIDVGNKQGILRQKKVETADALKKQQDKVQELSGQNDDATQKYLDAKTKLDELNARAYVTGGDPSKLEIWLGADNPTDAAKRQVIVRAAGDERVQVASDYENLRKLVGGDLAEAVDKAQALKKELSDVTAEIQTTNEDAKTAGKDLEAADMDLRLKWRDQRIANGDTTLLDNNGGTGGASGWYGDIGIPIVALDAYRLAATYANSLYPDCHISWWGIAGIGAVESGHGSHGGAQVMLNGEVWPHIRGIALNGQSGTAVIRDTDRGYYDDDTTWDRAVGPMQFIPGTWESYAAKFNLDVAGDGKPDPDNMYDAARATGIMLCRNTWSMADPSGMWQAYFAYNPSSYYASTVLGRALNYARWAGDMPPLTGPRDPGTTPPTTEAPTTEAPTTVTTLPPTTTAPPTTPSTTTTTAPPTTPPTTEAPTSTTTTTVPNSTTTVVAGPK